MSAGKDIIIKEDFENKHNTRPSVGDYSSIAAVEFEANLQELDKATESKSNDVRVKAYDRLAKIYTPALEFYSGGNAGFTDINKAILYYKKASDILEVSDFSLPGIEPKAQLQRIEVLQNKFFITRFQTKNGKQQIIDAVKHNVIARDFVFTNQVGRQITPIELACELGKKHDVEMLVTNGASLPEDLSLLTPYLVDQNVLFDLFLRLEPHEAFALKNRTVHDLPFSAHKTNATYQNSRQYGEGVSLELKHLPEDFEPNLNKIIEGYLAVVRPESKSGVASKQIDNNGDIVLNVADDNEEVDVIPGRQDYQNYLFRRFQNLSGCITPITVSHTSSMLAILMLVTSNSWIMHKTLSAMDTERRQTIDDEMSGVIDGLSSNHLPYLNPLFP